MINEKTVNGHIYAFITILIWGTTFISTKILLKDFTPIEILFIRFIIGYFALWIVYPHKLKLFDKKEERLFALAGLCGVTLYYLFENIALTYTFASNVGVIISIAPFFTAIISCAVLHNERPDKYFFIGFVIAMVGICFISFDRVPLLKLNPLGDVLAMVAAILWAFYSTITKKISELEYNTIQTTRRTFFYGLLFMVPALFIFGFHVEVSKMIVTRNFFNFLFLSLGASALCFVTWNFAVKILGSVKTSIYIYIVPVITTITSVIILNEEITFIKIGGIAMTLIGLALSGNKNLMNKLAGKLHLNHG